MVKKFGKIEQKFCILGFFHILVEKYMKYGMYWGNPPLGRQRKLLRTFWVVNRWIWLDIRRDMGIWRKIDHFLKGKMGTKIQNVIFQPISNRFLHFKNSFLWFSTILNTFLQGRTHIPRQIPKLVGLSLRSRKGPTSTWPYRKIKLATLKIWLCHLVGLDFLGEWVLTVGKNPRRLSARFAWWKPPENIFKTPHPR